MILTHLTEVDLRIEGRVCCLDRPFRRPQQWTSVPRPECTRRQPTRLWDVQNALNAIACQVMTRKCERRISKEARFEALAMRIALHRPITAEQSQEVFSLAAELAVVRQARPARRRILMFPSPQDPEPNGDVALEHLARVLTQLSGQQS